MSDEWGWFMCSHCGQIFEDMERAESHECEIKLFTEN